MYGYQLPSERHSKKHRKKCVALPVKFKNKGSKRRAEKEKEGRKKRREKKRKERKERGKGRKRT